MQAAAEAAEAAEAAVAAAEAVVADAAAAIAVVAATAVEGPEQKEPQVEEELADVVQALRVAAQEDPPVVGPVERQHRDGRQKYDDPQEAPEVEEAAAAVEGPVPEEEQSEG